MFLLGKNPLPFPTFIFFNFLFGLGEKPVKNAVILPGEWWSHTHKCVRSPPNSPPIQVATQHWAEFHVPHSMSLSAIHFKYAVCACPASRGDLHSVAGGPFPHLQSQQCGLSLHLSSIVTSLSDHTRKGSLFSHMIRLGPLRQPSHLKILNLNYICKVSFAI